MEVRSQLQQIRAQRKDVDRRSLQKSMGFEKIFSKELYDVEIPKPIIRETLGKEKKLLISTSALAFDYSGDSVLRSVDMDFREAWCTGLVGLNASGKTTLARLLKGQLKARSGCIQHHGLTPSASPSSLWNLLAIAGLLVVVLAVAIQFFATSAKEATKYGFFGFSVVSCFILAFYCGQPKVPKHLVLHLSSETSDKDRALSVL